VNSLALKRALVTVCLAGGIALVIPPSPARATDYRSVEGSSPQEVVDAMANKVVRGIANVATGWLELPKQIYLTVKEDGVAKGIFVGPLRGMGMTLVRTVSGAGETLTFMIPYPGFFDPYFEPAYVWQKE
jgi:putative exosortase-associated protein (TIGR04073 family)